MLGCWEVLFCEGVMMIKLPISAPLARCNSRVEGAGNSCMDVKAESAIQNPGVVLCCVNRPVGDVPLY